MESSANFRVAKQVQDLVQCYLPPSVKDAHVQRYVQYCMRILSSRIQPYSENADKDHVKMLLIKQSKLISQTNLSFPPQSTRSPSPSAAPSSRSSSDSRSSTPSSSARRA